MMINTIRKIIRKNIENKENKFVDQMSLKVKTLSDDELVKLNQEYHHGIAMDKCMGCEIKPYIYKVDDIIENEMRNRNLKSCAELEEENYIRCR